MDEEYESWRNLVGDYMLTFAEVEGELNSLLSDVASISEYQSIVKMQFKERIKHAKLLVSQQVAIDELTIKTQTLLDKLIDFAEK